jgi:hypothetical protein
MQKKSLHIKYSLLLFNFNENWNEPAMLKPQFDKLLQFTSTCMTIMFIENATEVLKPAQYSLLQGECYL